MRCAVLAIIATLIATSGCIVRRANPLTTQPATAVDPQLASAQYWLDRPVNVTITTGNFDDTWEAAQDVARQRGFVVDRQDYRAGVMTTDPLTGAQPFEPWKQDLVGSGDRLKSALATYRRTLRYEVDREDDGTFTLTPKVVVERQSKTGSRVQSVGQIRNVIGFSREVGSPEIDRGIYLPPVYWYAVGRDPELERAIALQVSKRAASARIRDAKRDRPASQPAESAGHSQPSSSVPTVQSAVLTEAAGAR